MPSNWINRTVGFNRSDPDEMALFYWSKNLPNFTELVKRHLRQLKSDNALAVMEIYEVFALSQENAGMELSPVVDDVEQFF